MRLKLSYFILILLLSSCGEGSPEPPAMPETEESSWITFFIAACCLIAGIIAGTLLSKSRLLAAKGKSSRPEDKKTSTRKTPEGRSSKGSEQSVYDLEDQLRRAQYTVEELKRRLAEMEKLVEANTLDTMPEIAEPGLGKQNVAAGYEQPLIREPLYFLQPTTEGWFMEAGQVAERAEALYVLNRKDGRTDEASVQFIDHPANTSMALQNESSWILVACERSNIISAGTTSIRTDAPGKAILKNGAWQIIVKAKITYC